MRNNPLKTNMIAGHKCGGYSSVTAIGVEHDCNYDIDFPCEDCVFIVGSFSNDFRKGKKPWSKKYQTGKP